MATTTFKKVQKKINEIVSIEIQSDKYVQDTVFLKKMKSIYQKIRNDAKAQIDNLLKNQYQKTVLVFYRLPECIDSDFRQTQSLELNQFITELTVQLDELTPFTERFYALPVKVQNHDLMKSFLQEINNRLETIQVHHEINQLNSLVDDINSRFSLSAILKRYQSLKNTYPALKNEINTKIKQNHGNNFSSLANYCEERLSQIQQLTDSIDQLPKKVKKHTLMTHFLAELKRNLTTENFDHWNTKYQAQVTECNEEIRNREGWDIGDYHCYGDGVIYDKRTKLYWYVADRAAYFSQANEIILQLNKRQHHGFNNWRLPCLSELARIRDIAITKEVGNICCWSSNKAGYIEFLIYCFEKLIKKLKIIIAIIILLLLLFSSMGLLLILLVLVVLVVIPIVLLMLIIRPYIAVEISSSRIIYGNNDDTYQLILVRG